MVIPVQAQSIYTFPSKNFQTKWKNFSLFNRCSIAISDVPMHMFSVWMRCPHYEPCLKIDFVSFYRHFPVEFPIQTENRARDVIAKLRPPNRTCKYLGGGNFACLRWAGTKFRTNDIRGGPQCRIAFVGRIYWGNEVPVRTWGFIQ